MAYINQTITITKTIMYIKYFRTSQLGFGQFDPIYQMALMSVIELAT